MEAMDEESGGRQCNGKEVKSNVSSFGLIENNRGSFCVRDNKSALSFSMNKKENQSNANSLSGFY